MTLLLFAWLGYLVSQALLGFFYIHHFNQKQFSWFFPLICIPLAQFLWYNYHPIIQMLTLIIPLLHAMKIVVAVHSREAKKLSLKQWCVYFFFSVRMEPAIFLDSKKATIDTKILFKGLLHIVIGLILIFVVSSLANTDNGLVYWVLSIILLIGLSFILHFGILPINTFLLKIAGFRDEPIFNKPYLSSSLSEFWSKRWNVAFSEMASITVFKPLLKTLGHKASYVAFLFSGLLHELAISLPVKKGYGLPMIFFLLQAVGMVLERKFFKHRAPGTFWVLLFLILPMPLLFHQAFLEEVIWPLPRFMKAYFNY